MVDLAIVLAVWFPFVSIIIAPHNGTAVSEAQSEITLLVLAIFKKNFLSEVWSSGIKISSLIKKNCCGVLATWCTSLIYPYSIEVYIVKYWTCYVCLQILFTFVHQTAYLKMQHFSIWILLYYSS